MGLRDLFRRRRRAGTGPRPATDADTEHLRTWSAARIGVEAYIEPKTHVTETTVVLIAHDGEWTRRRIAGPEAAYRLGRKIGIPVYEVQRLGYPQRMRDYQARQRAKRDEVG